MDQTGLVFDVVTAAALIDRGRKGFATDGGEHEGRLAYEKGIALAAVAFAESHAAANPQIIILAESAFLQQELEFCGDTDTYAISSLQAAIQSFEDALRSLQAVADKAIYTGAEKTWPTSDKYRTHGYPRDAVHIACIAHRTRIQNILRVPGMNMTEKAVYEQRAANMSAAQTAYLEKQKSALSR